MRRAICIAFALALAAAPAAGATPPAGHGKPANPGSQGQGHGKGKPKGVTYVFKGTYQGSGSVAVDHGNAHVKKAGFVGQTVSFDLTGARIVVRDNNGDGAKDLADVAVDDRVVVKSRMPRKQPAAQPFPARQLVDQTQPPALAP